MTALFQKKTSLFGLPLILLLFMGGCATSEKGNRQQSPKPSMRDNASDHALLTNLDRPVPNPINDEIPDNFYKAVEKNTRTMSGKPGTEYWQNQGDYEIDVEILPEQKKLVGQGTITYYNNSPDTLQQIFLELSQNVHQQGAIRNEAAEITGGVNIQSFSYDDNTLEAITRQGQTGYFINGTMMVIIPDQPLLPGDSATMQATWDFTIPQRGAGGRMGYNGDNLIFMAYWYPKVRLYDDVVGWSTDPFLINAEFYNEFGNFNVDITAPQQWIVAATGNLTNADAVLRQPIHDRLKKAHNSDAVINVVDKNDFGNITRGREDGKVTWNFTAEDVNDFAFSLSKESIWDATRTPVGDRDGDGTTDYTHIDAFYRSSAPLWKKAARYEQHVIKFLSEYTGLSYPWPHMTAVEGGGIIGGGMEFPMITLTGAYQGRSPESLYAVIAHELAHMWVPMQVASNERRYGWMDEGTTTFNENQAKKEYFDKPRTDQNEFRGYTRITDTDLEGEIMRRSDYHYSGASYGTASYAKPAAVLVTLRGLLGEETFKEAYRTFMQRWQFKHPYPWDFFNTFEDVSGRDLGWFWRSWYYETWELDQAVAEVTETAEGTRILIQDYGRIPMPAEVQITTANGNTITQNISVETWLRGATSTILTLNTNSPVTKVQIDPEHKFPDVNRSNNTWEK